MRPLLCVLLALAAACQHFTAQAPDGFSRFAEGRDFRAASADGVMFRVREESHGAGASQEFWAQAFRLHMREAGYAVVSETEIVSANGHPGLVLHLAAPVGSIDYAYVVGIFVVGKHIVIAEAAGEVAKVAARKEALLSALKLLVVE